MLWELDATGLAEAFRRGESDPAEALGEFRARIERIDPALNAFVTLNEAAETEAAASAERIRRGCRRPLDGVPLAIKDSLAVAGMPAAWGSRVFAGAPYTADELPVRRLRDAGAVILGKTNTPEFAVEGYTGNDLFGVTGNPWNPALTPGGSSGGTVAAVAAGLASAGIGTDGGGSIRRPAAYTGLFGLKPTIGRCARAGGLPQVLLDFEVVGPLTRSARDLRLIYHCLAGPDPADPRSRAVPNGATAPHGLRILYVETFGDAPLDPGIRASVADAARRLGEMGHRIEAGALPFDLGPLNENWGR
ncbi:MAG TPA: amidase, partial [Thermohalobaculum sp.]|nr:amidase [Thermohalobaculum sp.]